MNCTASQNKTNSQKFKERAAINATRFILVATASVLTDKYGFGKQKVQQIIKSIEDRADSINKGYINIEDLEQILLDEYDIKFTR